MVASYFGGQLSKRMNFGYGSTAHRDQRDWVAAKPSSLAPQLAERASRDDIAGIRPHLVGTAPIDPTDLCGQVSRKNWRPPVASLWREPQSVRRPTPAPVAEHSRCSCLMHDISANAFHREHPNSLIFIEFLSNQMYVFAIMKAASVG